MGFEGYDDWKTRDESDEEQARLEGEEARRCPTCESLNHRECDEEILRMDDPPESEVQ